MAWKNMSDERYKQIIAEGNLQDVCEMIERESGLEIHYIMRTISIYVESLRSVRQRELFQLYYFFHFSVMKLKYFTGIEYHRIEKYIECAVRNLIKMYVNDSKRIEKNKGRDKNEEKKETESFPVTSNE